MSARRAVSVLLTIALASVFLACGQTAEDAKNSPSATALGAAATAAADAQPAAADDHDTLHAGRDTFNRPGEPPP